MSIAITAPKRLLRVLSLLMIAVISVDSLRNLPINAQYGLPLVSFYLIAGLGFFLPLIIVTIDFATRLPYTGGSYLWIKDAFGPRFGFISIWLQWIYNLIWYPTIFAFISTTIASMIDPALETDQHFIFIISLFLYWGVTGIAAGGIRAFSWLSMICAIFGTLLPMLLIVCLAAFWLMSHHPSAIPLTWHGLIPTENSMSNLMFFANILFSLLGIDVVAIHAGDVREPAKTYPRALFTAGAVILVSLILSSLALCIVIPPAKIGLLNGLVDVFAIYFNHYNLHWAAAVIALAIILGSLGIASSWIIGIARGLQVASAFSPLPQFMSRLNRFYMPHGVLLLQGAIFSCLLCAFLLFPNINNAYWMLSSMTAQFALLYYLLLFSAAFFIYLRIKSSWWRKMLPIVAIFISIIGIVVGFLPPQSVVAANHVLRYELILCGGGLAFLVPLFILLRKKTQASLD